MLLILISNIRLSFAPLNDLLFLSFKVKFPTFLRSGVVYYLNVDAVRVVCGSNHAPFTHQSIGTPGTHSYNRTAVIQSSQSSIFSHINTTGHSANFDDFKILFSCSDTCELLIHESLFISNLKPNSYVQGGSIPLNLLNLPLSCVCFVSSFVSSCLTYTLLSFIILSNTTPCKIDYN